MNYLDARSKIKNGDLLAWSHRGWSTWKDIKVQLVRLFTRSEYSHVGVAMVFGGRVWVVESVKPLVRIVPLRNLLPCYWAPTGLQWTEQTREYALGLVGSGCYSEWEAVKAFFGHNTNPQAWECAELVQSIYRCAGVRLHSRAVPSDVVREVLERGAHITTLEAV